MLHGSVPLAKYRSILNKIPLSRVFPEEITPKNPLLGLNLPKGLNLNLLGNSLVSPYCFSASKHRNLIVGPYTLALAEMLGLDFESFIPIAMGIDIFIAGHFDLDDLHDSGDLRRGQISGRKKYGPQISMNTADVMILDLLRIINDSDFSDSSKLFLTRKYILAITETKIAQSIEFQSYRSKEIFNVEHYFWEYRILNHITFALPSEILLSQLEISKEGYDAIVEHNRMLGFVAQAWNDVHNVENPEYYKSKDNGIPGGDILNGKRTIVLSQAIENLPKSKSERLKDIINLEQRNSADFDEALQLVLESRALESIKSLISRSLEQTWKQVDKFVPDSPAKTEIYRTAFEFGKFTM